MDAELDRALPRWEAFLASARHRTATLPADLDAELSTLITKGLHASPAFDEVMAKLDRSQTALEDDLDHAWRELSAAFATTMSHAEASGDADALRSLRWQRTAERRKADALREQLSVAVRKVSIEARADAARASHADAAADWAERVRCTSCGAPIEVGAVFETTDFRCGACGARTRVEPSEATRAYLRAERIEAIADEAVMDDLFALDQARRRYTGWLHPLDDDFQRFESVAKRTWMGWAEFLLPLHPAWDAVRARREAIRRVDETLGPWRADSARERREVLTRGCALIREGKQREALDLAHASRAGAARFLDDLSVCLHEHEDRGAAWQCLALTHHVARVPEDRDAWMRRRIAELDEALRTR